MPSQESFVCDSDYNSQAAVTTIFSARLPAVQSLRAQLTSQPHQHIILQWVSSHFRIPCTSWRLSKKTRCKNPSPRPVTSDSLGIRTSLSTPSHRAQVLTQTPPGHVFSLHFQNHSTPQQPSCAVTTSPSFESTDMRSERILVQHASSVVRHWRQPNTSCPSAQQCSCIDSSTIQAATSSDHSAGPRCPPLLNVQTAPSMQLD